MEFQYFGGNCVKISTKKASLVIDDNLAELGLKYIVSPKDIALYTSSDLKKNDNAHFVISDPGEYEVSDVSVHGVAARSHMDEASQKSATIYRVILDDTRIAIVGHIYPELSDDQLEAIGTIDVLFVPVGGNGFTLDGVGAQKIIKKIEPKLVVPTHYGDSKIKYEVPQTDLEEALKNLSLEPTERVESLKVKNLELTDTTKLIVLERQ